MSTLPTYGWGLIGPGRFARKFAAGLSANPRARRVAVASRDPQRAAGFATEFQFERSYGSYEELVADEAVDIVYIVVPHVFHRDLAGLAIRAGKAVVCEKPLTLSEADTTSLTALASESGVFLMEALKTGFLPAIQQVRTWLAANAIGEVQLLKADFCFQGPTDPDDRLMNPDLGGGCILDIGIYPLFLARHLLGDPLALHATGRLTHTGVEETAVIATRHPGGACAALTCSFRSESLMAATVLGTEGSIRIPRFHAATTATLQLPDGREDHFHSPETEMVAGEIAAVHDSLDRGLLQCPGHTHHDSIRLAALMDDALAQIRRPIGG